MAYVKGTRPIPDPFLASAPGTDHLAPPRGDLSSREREIISQIQE
jgi:hypothetical protein